MLLALIRAICVAYGVVLTVLLLAPADAAFWGDPDSSLNALLLHIRPFAHFLAMFGFASLMLLARWPIPKWATVALIAGYALGTESLQGLVPSRKVDPEDFLQNLVGLGAAVALTAVVQLAMPSPPKRRSTRREPEEPMDEWEILRRVHAVDETTPKDKMSDAH